jgi:hypothetical protein
MHMTSGLCQKSKSCGTLADFYFFFRLAAFFSGFTSNTRRIKSSNDGSGFHFVVFDFNAPILPTVDKFSTVQ